MTSNPPKKPRAVAAKVRLTLGVISTLITLDSYAASKKEKSTAGVSEVYVCPTCPTTTPLSHRLVCDADASHGQFHYDEVPKKVVALDATLVDTSEEQVEELKRPSVPPKMLDLGVFWADQVENQTEPAGNVFRVRAPEEPDMALALIRLLAENPRHALLGEFTLKGRTGFYRLVAREGTLVLAELNRPELVQPFQSFPEVEVPEVMAAHAARMIEELVGDFDPLQYLNERTERLMSLKAEIGDAPAEMPEVPNVSAAASELRLLLGGAA